jgi:hypothetical protein
MVVVLWNLAYTEIDPILNPAVYRPQMKALLTETSLILRANDRPTISTLNEVKILRTGEEIRR